MVADEPALPQPGAVVRSDPSVEFARAAGERRPRRLRRGTTVDQLEEQSHSDLVAVEEGLFLAGEVVGEGASGDRGRVGDGLDRHAVGPHVGREAEGGLVQCLPGGRLLALAQPARYLHGPNATPRTLRCSTTFLLSAQDLT